MKTQLLQNEAAKATSELLVVFAADQQTSKEPNAKADPVLLSEDAALLSAAKSAFRVANLRPPPLKPCCSTPRPE